MGLEIATELGLTAIWVEAVLATLVDLQMMQLLGLSREASLLGACYRLFIAPKDDVMLSIVPIILIVKMFILSRTSRTGSIPCTLLVRYACSFVGIVR